MKTRYLFIFGFMIFLLASNILAQVIWDSNTIEININEEKVIPPSVNWITSLVVGIIVIIILLIVFKFKKKKVRKKKKK